MINVASMHQVYRDYETKKLVGVGFGFTEKGELPKDALAAVIPIASLFCGTDAFAASACASFGEFVLADRRAGSGVNTPDSCGGDSGAPIFWVPPSLGKEFFKLTDRIISVVGVTSRALDGVRHIPGLKCGGGGIYTSVGHPDVIRWLGYHGIFVRTELQLDPAIIRKSLGKK